MFHSPYCSVHSESARDGPSYYGSMNLFLSESGVLCLVLLLLTVVLTMLFMIAIRLYLFVMYITHFACSLLHVCSHALKSNNAYSLSFSPKVLHHVETAELLETSEAHVAILFRNNSNSRNRIWPKSCRKHSGIPSVMERISTLNKLPLS